jgi:predicted transcriptional regulator YdeE
MRCLNPNCLFCRKTLVVLVLLAAMVPLGHAVGRQAANPPANGPTTKPDAPDLAQPIVVSKSRVLTISATTFFYTTTETSLKEIDTVAKDTMQTLHAAIKDGKLHPTGAPIFIYHGVNEDPDHKFTLQIGFPVADDTAAFGDFKVIKLPEFHCATALYSGPLKQQTEAWQSLYGDLFAAGMQPSDEAREEYLKFDGEDSPNNVILIEAGLQ